MPAQLADGQGKRPKITAAWKYRAGNGKTGVGKPRTNAGFLESPAGKTEYAAGFLFGRNILPPLAVAETVQHALHGFGIAQQVEERAVGLKIVLESRQCL